MFLVIIAQNIEQNDNNVQKVRKFENKSQKLNQLKIRKGEKTFESKRELYGL